MTDIVSRQTRSRMMAGIRGQDTFPELTVRRFLHRAGFRFRIAAARLPGKPDIVLPKHRTVVFVHGCFWHRHSRCKYATVPATRRKFWLTKFEENVARDKRVQRLLRRDGWRVLVVWECRLAMCDLESLQRKILAPRSLRR